MTSVSLTVNGHAVELDADGDPSLLLALREQLGLRGIRVGCALGECGACTVVLDGTATSSCDRTLAQTAGATITTPEGLGGADDPHPIQQRFLQRQAAQCGYCVNGIIMRCAALVEAGGVDDIDDVVSALDQQLCRCGTHARLLEAACAAVGDGDVLHEAEERSRLRVVRHPEGPAGSTSPSSGSSSDSAADGPAGPEVPGLPPEIEGAPDVAAWLDVTPDGRVGLLPLRSEIGQGVHVAFAQIVATQLGVSTDLIDLGLATTERGADRGVTAGSRSVKHGGDAVARATRALRRLLLERAADHLDVEVVALSVLPEGAVEAPDGRRVGFADLVADGPVAGAILASDRPDWTLAPAVASPPRDDLADKLTGSAAFIHDLHPAGLLHARAVLPPTYEAVPDVADLDAEVEVVRGMPGVVSVIHQRRLLMVVATGETLAMRAAAALEARLRWAGAELETAGGGIAHLRTLPSETVVRQDDDGVDAALADARVVRASYAKPYQSHGSMAPSCALAQVDDGHLTVWSHTQGVHPLRRELAAFFEVSPDTIAVLHGYGPGCYGMNGADDAAALAAVAARAVPGQPVRFQFSTADEFGWEPHGTAMAADVEAGLDDDGRIVAWRHRVVTDRHTARPNGDGDRLAAAWLRADAATRARPAPGPGGDRNLVPIYDVGPVTATVDHVDGPLRTGSLRTLGSFFNVFAIESQMDELAERAGEDPVAFRLRHLTDPRATEVLQIAAETAGWEAHVGPSGAGRGIALARYHGVMGYVAIVADVEVDVDVDRLRVERLVIVSDVGTIVHVDGLRQQLEGGALQGLSRTLFEQVAFDRNGITSRDWSTYPVLRFSDVPRMEVVMVDRPGLQPLGAGEISTPVVPAAIANAIDDAIGVRLRELPITPQAIRSRLLDLDPAEAARVLVG